MEVGSKREHRPRTRAYILCLSNDCLTSETWPWKCQSWINKHVLFVFKKSLLFLTIQVSIRSWPRWSVSLSGGTRDPSPGRGHSRAPPWPRAPARRRCRSGPCLGPPAAWSSRCCSWSSWSSWSYSEPELSASHLWGENNGSILNKTFESSTSWSCTCR